MSALIESLSLDRRLVVDLLERLRLRGQTIATAESLTAGLLCAVLTDVPGASAVVRGGLIVYATDLKSGLANVDPQLIAQHGAVHPDVAQQLAAGARAQCAADWGIGLTGVAGPDGQDGVAPGTVYVGLSGGGGASNHQLVAGGDRHEVRAHAVRAAVEHFAEFLR